MPENNVLSGKRVLLVDDEPDVLGALEDILDMCRIEKASTFEEAKELLESRDFDIAVLDVMGVDGYALLEIANQRKIPAVILTAHAFSPEYLVKTIKEGGYAYIPKEEISHIADYLIDALEAKENGKDPWEPWQERLPSSYFEKRWGSAWKDTDKEFWDKFRSGLKSRRQPSKKG
jgi:DNA-binding NtrC family response regulator